MDRFLFWDYLAVIGAIVVHRWAAIAVARYADGDLPGRRRWPPWRRVGRVATFPAGTSPSADRATSDATDGAREGSPSAWRATAMPAQRWTTIAPMTARQSHNRNQSMWLILVRSAQP